MQYLQEELIAFYALICYCFWVLKLLINMFMQQS